MQGLGFDDGFWVQVSGDLGFRVYLQPAVQPSSLTGSTQLFASHPCRKRKWHLPEHSQRGEARSSTGAWR